MRVALVSKTNGCVGGASYFVENLGAWFLESGHEIVQFCAAARSELREYQRAFQPTGFASRVVRHLNWRARRLGLVEPFPWEYWFGLRKELYSFDIVHFHDLYMSISPRTLASVAKHRPVVFTMHDCSAFTGGCINPQGCRRFQNACGACPQKGELGQFDFTRSNLRQMRRLARSNKLTYVCPSRWIAAEASKSLGSKPSIQHIPNGFDPRPYRFHTRTEARGLLGIRPETKVVAVSCASFENKLKGMRFAFDALLSNRDLDPLALLIGHPSSGGGSALPGIRRLLPGFVVDRAKLSLYYAAADLLLYPSLGDNLPVTIQESMAAGTPVLAFAVGGVPELVRHGETGWLVPVGDQDALNAALRNALGSDTLESFGIRARRFIEKEFDRSLCVERHLNLYRSAIRSESAPASQVAT